MSDKIIDGLVDALCIRSFDEDPEDPAVLKRTVERLREALAASEEREAGLTDEVERLQKEFRYLTEILSDGDWNEAIIMRVVYRALGGEE